MTPEPVTFHLPRDVLAGVDPLKPYYMKLIAGLRDQGHAVQTVAHLRDTTLQTVAEMPGIHVADHGRLRAPQLLNTGIAYLYPFWNLDPWGIRALSSIAQKSFDPGSLDRAAASAFAARLRGRHVGARTSRYAQLAEKTDVPPDCIAVFLQSEHHRDVEETCYLTMRQMLVAIMARNDPRPIVIKPHPRDHSADTAAYLAQLAVQDPRVQITNGNIHDILARAAVAVTINSAVGIEAHLHRVPAVLCGQSDFHHAATTVFDAAQMDDAIAHAVGAPWPHDAYLYWYFDQQCLNAGRPTLVTDFLAKARLHSG